MRALLTCLPLLVLTACGQGQATSSAPSPSAPTPSGTVQTVSTVTVYDDGTRTRLCPGGTAGEDDCGGPVVTNWDWKAHPPEIKADGTRTGDFHVVGRYDGSKFTVTEATALADYQPPAEPEPKASDERACTEPTGGWEIPDPELTDFEGAMTAVEKLPDYGSASLDRVSAPGESDLGDPRNDIFVVSVEDDLTRAERTVRKHWGGRLCVLKASHSAAELDEVAGDLGDVPGHVSAVNLGDDVELYVVYDNGSIQDWADEEFGDGTVRVRSALVPA